MTENKDTRIEIQERNKLSRESYSDETMYSKIANDSIKYIQSEKKYLYQSVIISILILILQIVNLILVVIDYRLLHKISPRPRPLFDFLIPIFIILIVSIFIIIHLSYLLRWNSKVNKYTIYKEIISNENNDSSSSKKFISLSQIFYDVINHMKSIRAIFYVLNIFSILYLVMILREVLGNLRIVIIRDYLFKIPWLIINLATLITVSIYLALQWKYFLKWNNKLEKLEEFERLVYNELDFD